MTDTGWTFDGFRVIESENAPDPNGIKHLGTVSSDHTPFLSRIVNTCDLHGAILDVSDPVQNMRAAYDYHTQRNVNASKERAMSNARMEVLAYLAIASELFTTGSEDYSEGEGVEGVKARLNLARAAIDEAVWRLDRE